MTDQHTDQSDDVDEDEGPDCLGPETMCGVDAPGHISPCPLADHDQPGDRSMTEQQTDQYVERAKALVEAADRAVRSFEADMRDKGIHVGVDRRCVTCHRTWPCRPSQGKCPVDLGTRPCWMSPDQYDECWCVLPFEHEGDCECEHTRKASHGSA